MRYREARSRHAGLGLGLVLLMVTLAAPSGTLGASPGPTRVPREPGIQVLVYNRAGVSEKLLSHAEEETTYLLKRAGAQVEWIDCAVPGRDAEAAVLSQPAPCGAPLNSRELALSIDARPANKRFDSDAAGYSQVSARTGQGSYAGIFYDRVTDAAMRSGASVSDILGGVAAHEIGHLLLGLRSHSEAGIMRASWSRDDLRLLSQRQLRFTAEQGERIRADVLERNGDVGAAAANSPFSQ